MIRIDVAIERYPLAAPFRIARGAKTEAVTTRVTLRDGVAVGRGEAMPYPRYGETAEGARDLVLKLGRDTDRATLAERLPPGAARNAVDCALWDLMAAQSGVPVAVASGLGMAVPVPTARTIAIDTPDRMAAAAAELVDTALLKVKVDADDPVARVAAVRRAAPHAKLIVDPNEAWDLPLLAAVQPALAALNVAVIEQPLPAEADAALDRFTQCVPLCADESCHIADDLDRVAGRYDMVNVKLDKAGGLTGAMALLSSARARGLGVMVGCMVAPSRAIAPAMLLARHADMVDLDGPLWLAHDQPGGVTLDQGMLLPPAPGFWG